MARYDDIIEKKHMFYLIALGGTLYLIFRGLPSGRATVIALGLLAALLLYLWGAYLAWDNPTGDPQGGMFRGFDLIALVLATALLGLAGWVRMRAVAGQEAVRPRRAFLFGGLAILALLCLAALYLG